MSVVPIPCVERSSIRVARMYRSASVASRASLRRRALALARWAGCCACKMHLTAKAMHASGRMRRISCRLLRVARRDFRQHGSGRRGSSYEYLEIRELAVQCKPRGGASYVTFNIGKVELSSVYIEYDALSKSIPPASPRGGAPMALLAGSFRCAKQVLDRAL